jgi:hypothetical protein
VSRGLGKVQRAVLDALQEVGGPIYVSDLIDRLYGAGEPPRAFAESVRRAVRDLTQKKLVCCGLVYTDWHDAERARTSENYGYSQRTSPACWLPAQQEPKVKPQIRGADVEQAIVELLHRTPLDAYEDGHNVYWIGQRVGQLYGQRWNHPEPRTHAAVHRAIHRLIEQGCVIPIRSRTGRVIRLRPTNNLLSCNTLGMIEQHLEDNE